MAHCGTCGKPSLPLHNYALNFEKIVSLLALGFLGIQKDKTSEIAAIPEATINTNAGEYNQTYPRSAGKTTAPIWLIVKALGRHGARLWLAVDARAVRLSGTMVLNERKQVSDNALSNHPRAL